MKSLLILLSLMTAIQAKAATQTIFSQEAIDYAKYPRTVYFSGTVRSYSANNNGGNIRFATLNFANRFGYDTALGFKGRHLSEVTSRHPLVGGDQIGIKAQCNGANSPINAFNGIAFFPATCQIHSLTVTTADAAPAKALQAPPQLPEPAPIYYNSLPAYVPPEPYVAPVYTPPSAYVPPVYTPPTYNGPVYIPPAPQAPAVKQPLNRFQGGGGVLQ